MTSRKCKFALRVLPVLIAAAYVGNVVAEDKLEEVVITAQKRKERLQDVPISITAISGAQLETRGIEGIQDLNALAPNLMFKGNPGSDLISSVALRGSSTSQPAIWMDPLVAMYIDGIYMGKAQGSVFDVIEIERVEVLRGPQGTLFGRNTEGGAVSIVSRRPTGVWGGSVSLDLGNRNHSIERVALDLPKMGIASVSVGYRKEDQKGWASNSTGPEMGKKDKEAYRLAAKFDVSKDFVVNYTYDHSDANNTPTPTSLFAADGTTGSLALLGLGPAVTGPFITTSRPSSVSTNTPAGQSIYEKAKTEGHALDLAYQLNDRNTLKYIYSTRKMKYDDSQDIDGMNIAGKNFFYGRHTDYKQDSHEIQWIGTADRAKYVLGYYHFEDDGTTLGPQDGSIFFLPNLRMDYNSTTKADAIYAQIDYSVTDKLTATAGFRRTVEEKGGWSHKFLTTGFDGPFLTDAPSPNTLPLMSYSAKFSGNTPMLALGYKYDDTTNFFGRLAKGFKSGGFSGDLGSPATSTPFLPQSSLSAEVGIKKSFAGNRAQLSASVFQTKITDQQVTLLIPGTASSRLMNAGKSTYQGFELEGSLIPVDGWKLQASYGYLHAKFDEYMDAARNVAGNPLIDTAGDRSPGSAPKNTFNLNVDGRLAQTPYGTLRGIVDYSYTGSMYLYPVLNDLTAADAGKSGNLASKNLMPAYSSINARLLLSGVPLGGPGRTDISFWVRNLTNEAKQLQGIDFGLFRTANWQEPRTYGITLNHKW